MQLSSSNRIFNFAINDVSWLISMALIIGSINRILYFSSLIFKTSGSSSVDVYPRLSRLIFPWRYNNDPFKRITSKSFILATVFLLTNAKTAAKKEQHWHWRPATSPNLASPWLYPRYTSLWKILTKNVYFTFIISWQMCGSYKERVSTTGNGF